MGKLLINSAFEKVECNEK